MNTPVLARRPWHKVIWYALFLFVALFFRFIYIDRIPSGLVPDELDYVLNAKAIYLSGKNIQGTWSPFSLTPIREEYPKAELPYFVSVPFVGPMSFSLFHAKIGYALVSVVFVLSVALLADTLFGFSIGVIAGFIASVNPWSIYFGRTAYDVPVAVTFYIIGTTLLLRFRKIGVYLAAISWFVAFYSYIGMKVLFLPYVFVNMIYGYIHQRQVNQKRVYIFVGFVLLLFFCIYLIRIQGSGVALRTDQLFTPYQSHIASAVEAERRMVIENPFIQFMSNKYIVYIKEITEKFIGAFNPSLLFVSGEGVATFSLWEHGLFYPIELIFLLIGLLSMWLQNKKIATWILFWVAISTMPSLLSTVGVSYVHRSSLMYPFFMIAISFGISKMYQVTQGRFKYFFIIFVTGLYVVQIINFSYIYFYRFPYYNSEAFSLSARIYSKLSYFAEKKGIPVTLLSDSPEGKYRNYLFYRDAVTKASLVGIRTSLNNHEYVINNITFTSVCPSELELASGSTMYIFDGSTACDTVFTGKAVDIIPLLSDGGSLYRVYNDKICGSYPLATYPTKLTISDFLVENLSEERFCKQFITRYTDPRYIIRNK